MRLEDKVLMAQKDDVALNMLIQEYRGYISSCAGRAVKRYITEHDDEMSIALMAFNEAVLKYNQEKGSFLNYAAIIIKNRLIDYQRKEYKNNKTVVFSSLSDEDNEGNETDFDVSDTKNDFNDVRYEIAELSFELNGYGISFYELASASPKSKKTRQACFRVIKFLIDNTSLSNEIKASGNLPIKAILESIDIHRKVVERHRKYIIAAVIILIGDYGNVAGYLDGIKEV